MVFESLRRGFVYLCLASVSVTAFADTIQFKEQGREVKKLTLEELAKIAPSQSVKVWDTNELKEITYQGIGVTKMFNEIYGPAWKKGEKFLITCRDGYKPKISVKRFSEHLAYFAISREGSNAFTITNQHEQGKVINVGPFYLIWDNLKTPTLHAGSDAHHWPYQVVSVDLDGPSH